MDAQDAQFFRSLASLVIPGIRRPAPDHRPSRLPVQQPLVLFILCILCIDVNCEGIFDLRRLPVPPTASAFAFRLDFCDSPSRGEHPLGARASRPHPDPTGDR